MSQAKERAENHWDHYVGPMQRVILEQMVEMCMSIGRFHYISSHIHGVKHAEQDADEVARGALANAAAHKAPSPCDSCADNHECGIAAVGGRPKTCVEHRPSICDSEVEKAVERPLPNIAVGPAEGVTASISDIFYAKP